MGGDKPKTPVQGNSEAEKRERVVREWREKHPKKKKKACCL